MRVLRHAVAGSMLACSATTAVQPESAKPRDLSWDRVELHTEGGPLPFVIESNANADAVDGGAIEASIVNGEERIPVRVMVREGGYEGPGGALLELRHYDSWIQTEERPRGVQSSALGQFLGRGEWRKKRGESYAVVKLSASTVRSADERFDPIPDAGDASGWP